MTARANTVSSNAIMAKRGDLTPKANIRANKKRGASAVVNLAPAREYVNTGTKAGAMLISPDKPLTEKQRLFVVLWAKGDSIPSASLRAGFADGGSMAYRMVRMPNILALKAKYEALYQEASQMTRQKVMDGLLEAVDMAKLMSEPATMVAGWREIGKMCGYFAPVEVKMKVDVSGSVVVDRLNGMSDAELLKIITSGNTPEISYEGS